MLLKRVVLFRFISIRPLAAIYSEDLVLLNRDSFLDIVHAPFPSKHFMSTSSTVAALESTAAVFFRRYRHATMIHRYLLQLPWEGEAAKSLDMLGSRFVIDSHVVRSVLRRDLPLSAAVGFFRWLERSGHFVHDAYTYSAILDALGKAGRITEMCAMLQEMREAGIELKAGLLSSLISWCGKAKDVRAAIRFWKQASTRDTMSYNVMLDLLAREKQYKRATKLYLVMVKRKHPNAWTFAILIKLLARAHKLDSAFLVLSILPKLKVRANVYTYASLMKACAEVGDIGRLKQLARDLAQVNHCRGEEFIPVLKVLVKAGRMKEVNLVAQDIWPEESWKERVLRSGMSLKDKEDEEPDNHLVNDLRFEGASKLGLSVVGLAEALSCWTPSIASGLEKMNINWDCQLAFQVIRQIEDVDVASNFFYWLKSRPGFQHDLYTYTFLAIKLGHERRFASLHDLLNHMENDGMFLSLNSFNTLIRYCSIAKRPREALDLFVTLEKKGLRANADTYAALIHVFSRGRNVSKVLELYRLMQEARLQPSAVTFAQVIHCVGQSGGIEVAQSFFDQMSNYDLEPAAHHYAALIGSYYRAGNKGIAVDWYRVMQQRKVDIPKDLYPVFERILQQCGHHVEAKLLAKEARKLVKNTQVKSSRQSRNDRKKAKRDRLVEQDLRLVYDILVQNLLKGTGLLSVGHE